MVKHFTGQRLTRLKAAVIASYEQANSFRKNRLEAVEQYVGKHYTDQGTDKEVPNNLIELAVSIFLRALAPRSPAVLVRTPNLEYLPFAAKLEAAFNQLLKQIGFAKTLRASVRDAIFGIGVLKVGYNGTVYADTVDLDDFVMDMTAPRYERCAFAGHTVRINREDARERFGSVVDNLAPVQGDHIIKATGETRITSLGQRQASFGETYDDILEFWEIWLRRENMIVVFSEDAEEVLSEDPWDGPASGPYHLLSFADVPGNLLPLPPVANWLDNHNLVNQVRRKLGRQAKRQKTLLLAHGGAEPDVTAVNNASDGDAVLIQGQRPMDEKKFGGPDQQNFALMLQMTQVFKEQAGNLDAIGGLSPQADTLGQDQMLKASASVRVQDMQSQVMDFLQFAVNSLGWFLWRYDLKIKAEVPFGFELDFLGSGMPFELGGPDDRVGEQEDYAFTVQPYSMEPQTPQGIAAQVDAIWNNAIMPLAPLMAQNGDFPNIEGYLRLRAKLAHLDELEQLVTFGNEKPPEKNADPTALLKPPHSTREYVRRSVSGTAPQGRQQAMVSTLMGAGVQPKEQP